MSQINFLPPSFRTEQARRKRVVRVGALCLMLAISGLVLCVVQRGRVRAQAQYLAVLNQKLDASRQQGAELAALQAQAKTLGEQVRIRRELQSPLPQTAVLAMLSEVVPPSVAIRRLTLAPKRAPVVRPPVRTRGRRAAKSPAAPAPAESAATAASPWSELAIGLEGYAPSGTEVARLVGALEEHPVFDRVRMQDDHPVELVGLKARGFRIELSVPLNREYRPTREAPDRRAGAGQLTEVAHAR